jgi:hypothetical protein
MAGIKEVAGCRFHGDSVASARMNSVGVVAPFISSWYYSNVIHGAEHVLPEAGYDLLLDNFGQMKGRRGCSSTNCSRGENCDATSGESWTQAGSPYVRQKG